MQIILPIDVIGNNPKQEDDDVTLLDEYLEDGEFIDQIQSSLKQAARAFPRSGTPVRVVNTWVEVEQDILEYPEIPTWKIVVANSSAALVTFAVGRHPYRVLQKAVTNAYRISEPGAIVVFSQGSWALIEASDEIYVYTHDEALEILTSEYFVENIEQPTGDFLLETRNQLREFTSEMEAAYDAFLQDYDNVELLGIWEENGETHLEVETDGADITNGAVLLGFAKAQRGLAEGTTPLIDPHSIINIDGEDVTLVDRYPVPNLAAQLGFVDVDAFFAANPIGALLYQTGTDGVEYLVYEPGQLITLPDGSVADSGQLLLMLQFDALAFGEAAVEEVEPGQIVFTSNRDGDQDIFLMNTDGSNVRPLTNNDVDDSSPAWSPDGQHIAFVSNDGDLEIYVMNADGSNVRRLTDNDVNDSFPAWSPDGNQIVFVQGQGSEREIYVMDADGSNVRRLTNNDSEDRDPAWSPDGQQIIFTRDGFGNFELHVMNADGSNVRRLTENSQHDMGPAWSPDGSQITIERSDPGNFQIYIMSSDGSNARRLTIHDNAVYGGASWSPDGRHIVFGSSQDSAPSVDPRALNFEIYVMDADGTNVRRLTNDTASDGSPAWQPTQQPETNYHPEAQFTSLTGTPEPIPEERHPSILRAGLGDITGIIASLVFIFRIAYQAFGPRRVSA